MTFTRKTYREITDSILSQITRGLVSEKYEYLQYRTKFQLESTNVRDIVKVDGMLKGAKVSFRKGTDYRLNGDMIEWMHGGDKPDDRTPFTVYYLVDTTMGITDVNPGTVTRTIVEAIALEMDYMYAQMNLVYNSGFIDTASDKSLDLVVALLGITRKAAGYANGEIIFGRNNEPPAIEVSREATVFGSKDRYELKYSLIKEVRKIEATAGGETATLLQGSDYDVVDNRIVFLPQGKAPDAGSVFYVDYAAYNRIVVPLNTMVSTYSRTAENIKSFRTTREAVLTKNDAGRWEVAVPVMATVPGREGNVSAGSVTVMPKPVAGIDFVINKNDMASGTGVESDSELRERARRALEMAGKATLKSLKSAVQGVNGVAGEVVVIDQPDGIPGIVQVIASGGDLENIHRAIEETRSAGIVVEFKRPLIIPLDVRLTVVVNRGSDRDAIKNRVRNAITEYMSTIDISQDVVISRIILAALQVPGVRDARDIYVNESKDNVDVKLTEKGELRSLEIFVEE
ncbi:baseplate J/gp47 family protein [Methanocella sp. MCL-LM]|uniref:baseplate J/gp47 family protein n=1 Tax=Methanocella sp. MCL-LM TaxID=3412035 RepID=UPI003C78144A